MNSTSIFCTSWISCVLIFDGLFFPEMSELYICFISTSSNNHITPVICVVITPVGKRQPLSDNYSSHLMINRIEKRRKLGVIYLLQMTSTWKLHAFEHWDVEGLEKNWKLPIFCFLSQLQLISYPKKKVNFFLTRLKGGPMSLCCYVLRAG